MSKIGTAVMASEYDDFGGLISEVKMINDFIEGTGWREVDLPEGFSGDCAE